MRLFLDDEQLLLDSEPVSADALRRNPKFKIRCRRYVVGEGPRGTLELAIPAN